MKYIKKVAVSPIPEINGSVVNTRNVTDKQSNALSIEQMDKENTYSTEETFTGKYWIDGKKIYRKVLNIDVTSFSTEITDIDYDCSTLDTVIDLRAMTERQYNVIETIPRIANSTDLNAWYGAIQMDRANHKIIIRLGTTFIDRIKNGYTFFAIVEYTKITDV